jgi:hypothetical protein
MRVNLTKTIYNLIGTKVFEKLKLFLVNQGVKVEALSVTSIWTYELIDIKTGHHTWATKLLTKDPDIGNTYFYKATSKYQNSDIAKFEDKQLTSFLKLFDENASGIQNQIKSFMQLFQDELTEEEIEKQRIELFKVKDTTKRQIERGKPKFDKWVQNLSNTTWWLYFYGYHDDNDKDMDGWNLLKLVLKFENKKVRQSNLDVGIQNTHSVNHYHYEGKTDFQMSGRNVLVLNFRTKDHNYRHLHFKFHVGENADGTFFIGQYLNYGHEEDQIFGGTIIMEKTFVENPIPNSYRLMNNQDDHLIKDYDEISHVVDFFKDKSMNFRRTTKQVHNLEDFKNWQEKRNTLKQENPF